MAVEVPCPSISVSDQGLKVRMPGGATLSVSVAETSPPPINIAKNLVTQANAALAPMVPVFNTIDAILAIKEFADAVPDLLTNPSAVVQAVAGIAEKVDGLVQLVPQVSVPVLAVDLIDVIITSLRGFRSQLEAVVEQQARILEAAATAEEPGNEALLPVVECAQALSDQVILDIQAGAAPLNQFFGVLNLFLGLAGLEPVPSLDGISSDAGDAVDELAAFEELLGSLRDAIPVP